MVVNSTPSPMRNLTTFLVRIIVAIAGSAFLHTVAIGQEFNYTHYTVQNGLAGSVVYCMFQDNEGFIWFGTETGVSRFDGTHFKNFTVKDGLPDNTILRIYGDSRGRIWMLPFKQSICYYYQGQIHNQQNDPLLKSLQIRDFVSGISENPAHDIVIGNRTVLEYISPQGTLKKIYRDTANQPVMTKMFMTPTGTIYVLEASKVYRSNGDGFRLHAQLAALNAGAEQVILHDQLLCWMTGRNELRVQSSRYQRDYSLQVPPVNTLSRLNDSVICINTTEGSFLFDIIRQKIIHHFLPGTNVSNYLVDSEGGTWFSSINDGVYRLNSIKVKNIARAATAGKPMSVYNLRKDGNTILAGTDRGYLQMILKDSVRSISLSRQLNVPLHHPVTSIEKKGNMLALGCGQNIFLKIGEAPFRYINAKTSIKDISIKNDRVLIIASSSELYSLTLPALQLGESFWLGRTTSLLIRHDSIYFGTLEGLYLLRPDRSIYYFGEHDPRLRQRVLDIREGKDNIIWVATGNAGVIGLKDNAVTCQLTTGNGLPSNNCRSVFPDSNRIWIGTDKGLARIDLSTRPFSATTFTTADGLPSDIINTILIDSEDVYAGTPEGVCYFNKDLALTSSRCQLKILGITIDGVAVHTNGLLSMRYGNNNLRVEYVGVSLRSAGNISYTYRVKGLDTVWRNTTQTSLELISLPAGEYTLELFATNKFGVKSNLITIPLIIHPPFWHTAWFIALVMLLVAVATWFVFTKRSRVIRDKEATQRNFEQKLQQLEQKALQAQMNPHFIFNCLNSVQDFILDHDIDSANKYLSNFSHLIRQTLDISMQPIISVADEIKYLGTYLRLEQMRFQDGFHFTIVADEKIDQAHTLIPGMVLQPFVENAIRHGIGNRSGAQGRIELTFSLVHGTIICTVSDNGVGRKNAGAIKAARQEIYPSRGMQLIQERIDIINKSQPAKIAINLSDIIDAHGKPAGTKVMIHFPLIQNDKR